MSFLLDPSHYQAQRRQFTQILRTFEASLPSTSEPHNPHRHLCFQRSVHLSPRVGRKLGVTLLSEWRYRP